MLLLVGNQLDLVIDLILNNNQPINLCSGLRPIRQSFVEDITSPYGVNDPPTLSLTPTEFSESEPAASPIALIEVDDQITICL